MSLTNQTRAWTILLALPATLALALPAGAESPGGKQSDPTVRPAVTAAAAAAAPQLDGRLDEPIWADAPAAAGFLQQEPKQGEPATQRTEVRFAYDAEALYVGARMYDEEGAAGVRTRLVRRDASFESDDLTLIFDTFNDNLGQTLFAVNPSGVKKDAYGPGGTNLDSSWDPVWEAATAVDSLGWTAEIRIPFSQLRFPQEREQTWGLQIYRTVHRLNERAMWSFWRLDETGGASKFGSLEQLHIAARPRRAELLPYVVARSAHPGAVDEDDPFADPSEQGVRVGADLKVLLTSNLTLDATVNPDFGQVEVDPAVVNLSAYETFFSEKRPFFIEGGGLLGFGSFSCWFCSNVSSMSLFYSRRIGRSPQGAALARGAGEYADVPDATSILGAAKITGRTENGWSVGILDAVTSREEATVVGADGLRSEVEVEPVSNYFVGRTRKDLKGGNLVVGGIATSVYRGMDSDDPLAERLNRHAESVGVDATYWWGERTYRFMGNLAVTQIAGEPEAILRAQRSSARYFQRPDREHGSNGLFSDRFDPEATSMRGFGGYGRVAKEAGEWRWESAVNFRSPGFEANDIAFLSRSDYVWMNANLNRQLTEPTRFYRRADFTIGGQQEINFDGDVTSRQVHAWVGTQTPFYWWGSAMLMVRDEAIDDRATRGGPAVKSPSNWFSSINFESDSRRALTGGANLGYGRNADGGYELNAFLGMTLRPSSNLSLSLGPSYRTSRNERQYVRAVTDPTASEFFGTRYVFADLEQRTFALETRFNVIFTPTMSLELFAQPFIASGRYDAFKEFAATRSLERDVYGRDIGTIAAEGEGADKVYTIDPDGDGAAQAFSIVNPDFTLRSLRGNAVFRWEFQPGSTLFLVWTQAREDFGREGDLDFGRDRRELFDAPADNIFQVKMNYWIGL